MVKLRLYGNRPNVFIQAIVFEICQKYFNLVNDLGLSTSAEIIKAVAKCPSGALSIKGND